jgi:hypothetical protein
VGEHGLEPQGQGLDVPAAEAGGVADRGGPRVEDAAALAPVAFDPAGLELAAEALLDAPVLEVRGVAHRVGLQLLVPASLRALDALAPRGLHACCSLLGVALLALAGAAHVELVLRSHVGPSLFVLLIGPARSPCSLLGVLAGPAPAGEPDDLAGLEVALA